MIEKLNKFKNSTQNIQKVLLISWICAAALWFSIELNHILVSGLVDLAHTVNSSQILKAIGILSYILLVLYYITSSLSYISLLIFIGLGIYYIVVLSKLVNKKDDVLLSKDIKENFKKAFILFIVSVVLAALGLFPWVHFFVCLPFVIFSIIAFVFSFKANKLLKNVPEVVNNEEKEITQEKNKEEKAEEETTKIA